MIVLLTSAQGFSDTGLLVVAHLAPFRFALLKDVIPRGATISLVMRSSFTVDSRRFIASANEDALRSLSNE